MEFNFRAGGSNRPSFFPPSTLPSSSSPSSSVLDGYFAAQALRAGFFGIGNEIKRSEVLPEPLSARDALQRELLKERMKRELIAREMMERRMLEEEVRREIEFERMMAIRSEMNVFLPLPGTSGRFDTGVRFSALTPDVRFGSRAGAGSGREFWVDEPRGVSADEAVMPAARSLFSQTSDAMAQISPITSVTGTKRKGGVLMGNAIKLPQPPKKEWSCALCEVNANSKAELDGHLNGKKHKAREARLNVNKTVSRNNDTSSSLTKETDKPVQELPREGSKTKKALKKVLKPNKKPKTEGFKKAKLWCDICEVRCYSTKTFSAHLSGKKHKFQLDKTSSSEDAAKAAKICTKGAEATNQNVEEEANELAKKVGLKLKNNEERVEASNETPRQGNNSMNTEEIDGVED